MLLRALLMTSFMFLSVLLGCTAVCAQSRPLIIIPGVLGSKLCDQNGSVIWGDRFSYTRTHVRDLALPYNFDPEQLPLKKCGLIDDVSIIPLFWNLMFIAGFITH